MDTSVTSSQGGRVPKRAEYLTVTEISRLEYLFINHSHVATERIQTSPERPHIEVGEAFPGSGRFLSASRHEPP